MLLLRFKHFVAVLAATTVAVLGESVKNTNNEVNPGDIAQAATCLGSWCRYNLIEGGGKVRCVHNSAVLYIW